MESLNQVLGIYSKQTTDKTGVGSTAKPNNSKTYYYIKRSDVDCYEAQPLNNQNIPSDIIQKYTKRDFLVTFIPELNFYEKKTLPALKSLNKKIELGEKCFHEGCLNEAEKAFAKALILAPQNIRANFGMGTVQCCRKNFKKLESIISILMNNNQSFVEKQRKEFNLFAITLRKQNLFDKAIEFYKKAIEINPKDENLHFNIARAYYEHNDSTMALSHIDNALDINPELVWAQKFKKYIFKNEKI